MKRISLLVLVALAAFPEPGWARSYMPYTSSVRYSPYAFGLKGSGLIPGNVHYNSYAFGTKHHGLTSDKVQFSPYAFSTKHSGLISTIGCDFVPCTPWFSDSRSEARRLSKAINTLSESVKPGTRPTYVTRPILRTRAAARGRMSRQYRSYSTGDQPSMVGEHLKKVIPGQYIITHLLRINRNTISFDIVLKEKNLVIKYWNQAKIESMNEKADPKEKQVYTDYIDTWSEFANRVELTGGTVVHLACKDRSQILGKLATHLKVNND